MKKYAFGKVSVAAILAVMFAMVMAMNTMTHAAGEETGKPVPPPRIDWKKMTAPKETVTGVAFLQKRFRPVFDRQTLRQCLEKLARDIGFEVVFPADAHALEDSYTTWYGYDGVSVNEAIRHFLNGTKFGYQSLSQS